MIPCLPVQPARRRVAALSALLVMIAVATPPAAVRAASPALQHVEPPSWWVGMRNPGLQLLLHGEGIAALQPVVRHPGVRLVRTVRTGQPDVLFLDLQIGPTAPPGEVEIALRQGGRTVLTHRYPLQARAPGSAQRRGFGPEDAIYLVVPDRFAQGDPARQADPAIVALGDRVDRSDPGARHGGDLKGLADRLDYIAGMGFTQLWPTPLVENRQPAWSYHGYAATDFYRIDPRFGTNAGYRDLVAKARARGIGVIQDVVLNHVGDQHWWTRTPPSPDWFNRHARYTETNHRHSTTIDPYAAAVDARRFVDGWFAPTMPDLNQRQPQLATYLTQMSIWWIEYADLSGLRIDTYFYSDKAFLARWSAAILAEYPRFAMVGEAMTGNPLEVAYWQRGRANEDGYVSAMPNMMDFPLSWALRDALKEPEQPYAFGAGLGRLYSFMAYDRLYADPRRLMLLEGNHDKPRIFTLLGEDEGLQRMMLAFIAVAPRIPQIFYGTELSMTSPAERDDGKVRADMPGGWAGDPVDAFSGTGLSERARATQAWVRALFTWRRGARAVHEGRFLHYAPQDGVYVAFRVHAAGRVMLVMNKGSAPAALDVQRFSEAMGGATGARDVITGRDVPLAPTLAVPARDALVLELR